MLVDGLTESSHVKNCTVLIIQHVQLHKFDVVSSLCFSSTLDEPQIVCNQKTLQTYSTDIGKRNWSTLIRNVIYILTLRESCKSLLQFINFSHMVTKIHPSETESNNYEFLKKMLNCPGSLSCCYIFYFKQFLYA